MTEEAAAAAVRQVADVVEFLDIIELTDVAYHEISGRRTGEAGRAAEHDSQSVAMLFAWEPAQVAVRSRLELRAEDAEYVVDVVTVYSLSRPATLTDAAARDFAAKVAIMAAYPYLRSGLHDLATRLRVPVPVLGLLRQGQVVLDRVEDTTPPSPPES
ncbi:MAG: hypothetical protein ACFCVF_03550 [Kineosporiaceae bacterium]